MEISFEFFPPKTAAGLDKLLKTAQQFATLKPHYFSVTFGAGGSTREHTPQTVATLLQQTNIDTAPHISCVSSSHSELIALLDHYQQLGVKRLVVLRGDKPADQSANGEFSHANQLVELIRQHSDKAFHITVAAYPETHPESHHLNDELEHFKRKVDCGADQAITQYFYNADAYFHFVDLCQAKGINIPIIPGIMPLVNYEKIARFSAMCGAEIPQWINKQCQAYGDDLQSIKQFGEEVTLKLCEKLLAGGAPGLHFYSLNQLRPSFNLTNKLNRRNNE